MIAPLLRGALATLAGLLLAAAAAAETVVATLPAGANPTATALNPVTGKTYVANQDGGTVTVIDNATNVTSTVTVGVAPWGLAVNPRTNRIYVANLGGNSVSVIDGGTDTVSQTVATGAGPFAIALNAVTNRIYVTNFSAATVTVINGADNVATSIPVELNPAGLAVNAVTNRIYVANTGSNTVSVIDGATGTVAATIAVGSEPRGVALNPVTNRVYVANLAGATLTVIDGATNSVIDTLTTDSLPAAVAVNPAANRIYVANTFGNSVTVVDGTNNSTSTVAVGTQPRALSVNVATHQVFVANQASANVTVIDGATNLATTVAAGTNPHSVVVNPVTNRAYVANSASNSVTVIDGWSSGRTGALAASSPEKIAINPVTHKIYALSKLAALVTVIDGVTLATTTVATGAGPFAIAINPVTNRIYVANRLGNSVTVIDGETNAPLTVAVGVEPRAIDVDAVTDRIYVANGVSNDVTVIDGATNATSTVIVGFLPIALAVNAATHRIYVANAVHDNVTVIDGSTKATQNVAVGSFPSAVAVNPVTNKVYVANAGGSSVTVIDGATHATTPVATGSAPSDLAVNSVTNKVYVANSGSGTVTVIDGATQAAAATVIAGTGPGSVAVNPVTNKIYVASSGIVVIDGVTHVPTTLAPGSSPDWVAVDPVANRIYVTNAAADSVTALDEGASLMTKHASSASLPAQLVTTLASPALTIGVGGSYAPTDPALRTVRYRQGDACGAHAGATGTGPFTASLNGLAPGLNYVSLFALDAMEGTAINGADGGAGGASVVTGAPRVVAIVYLPVRVTTDSLPEATYGSPYAATVAAEGFVAPLSLSISAGALPPGFSLNGASGEIAGTPQGTGTANFTVTATDPDGGTASRALSITVAKAPQFINIGTIPELSPSSPPFTVPATGGGSLNPVIFSTLSPAVCTTNGPTGATLAFFSAGICQLALTQAGNDNYLPAGFGLNIAVKIAQAIDFAPLADRHVGDPNFTLSATGGGSGNPVFFSSLTQLVCVLGGTNGTSVALIAAGTCTIQAGQFGDGTYYQAPFVTRSFTVLAAGVVPGAPVIGAASAGNASIAVAFAAPASIGSSAILDYTATCGTHSATGAGSPIVVSGLVNGTAYTCTVTARNAAGTGPASAPSNSVTPSAASPADIPRLFGISTRMQVLTGDNVMIAGVIIGGSTPKTVVVRARGPSLGVAGALANPTLTLVPAAGTVVTNDDWGTAGNAAALQATGFAPANAKESAIMATLAPGAYTAIVSGVGNSTGVAIVEVYELDHPEIPMSAISTRGRVQTGDNVMIGGFIIQGNGPQTVVVRARGPSLGVAGALADPTLTLVPASGPTIVNDDWGTAANAATLQASGFAPANAKESAILVTLNPGAYTAIVSGVGGTSGVAIVEVYKQ